ncbi:MAG: DUF4279 domain-containing protein [Gemmatimonadota bacterium]
MQNTTSIALIIADFICDPDEVSSSLEVEPTEVFRVGALIGRGPRTNRTSAWRLSPPSELIELTAQMDWLRARLPASGSVLDSISARWEAELVVVVEVSGASGPALDFRREDLEWLAEWRAAMDVSLRCL